ncbi:hypothetical protein IMY05_013G0086200 [Salix suchowensis]|nr:hypothetical protein IMY05_013G0086200 [Salix suchowensis]
MVAKIGFDASTKRHRCTLHADSTRACFTSKPPGSKHNFISPSLKNLNLLHSIGLPGNARVEGFQRRFRYKRLCGVGLMCFLQIAYIFVWSY